MNFPLCRWMLVLTFTLAPALALEADAASDHPATPPAASSPVRPAHQADDLARKVVAASGGDLWPTVQRVRFTFNVINNGEVTLSARHDWDLREGRNRVSWNDKNVVVMLDNPGDDPDSKAAFQRWTNDTYWLLAPLKLMDGGVIRTLKPDATIDGENHHVLHISFEGVGLTPRDQYHLYIDPETYLVRHWDYMPNPERTLRATWEDYQDVNGLKLATRHRMGLREVTLTDISIERSE